jgi:hypothetical protein
MKFKKDSQRKAVMCKLRDTSKKTYKTISHNSSDFLPVSDKIGFYKGKIYEVRKNIPKKICLIRFPESGIKFRIRKVKRR